jgi:hypothetical protein
MKRIFISLVAFAVSAGSLVAVPAQARVPSGHGVIPRYTSAKLLADSDFENTEHSRLETEDARSYYESENSRLTQEFRETQEVRQSEQVRESEEIRPPVAPPPVLVAPIFSQSIWVNSSFDFVVASSSNAPIVLTSSTPLVCSVTGIRVTTTALGGKCTIVATQDASMPPAATLAPASFNHKLHSGLASTSTLSTDLQVLPPQAQTITFGALADLKQGATQALVATSSSALPVTLASLTPDICTISNGIVTGVSGSVVGNTCTIIATQNGTEHYLAAAPSSRSFKVLVDLAKPALLLTPGAPTTFDFRVGIHSSFTLQLSNSGGGATYVVTGLPAGLSFDPTTGLISGSPTNAQTNTKVTVTATNDSGTSSFEFFITVDKGQATISFDLRSLVLTFTTGQARQPVIVATDPNGNPINVQVTYNGSSTFPTSPGTYTVQITCIDVNFACSSTSTLVINKAPQTLTVADPSSMVVGSDQTLVISAPSGQSPIVISQTPLICSVSGLKVTVLAAGTCTVQITQPGDANYTPADPVTKSFQVTVKIQAPALSSVSPGFAPVLDLGVPVANLQAVSNSGGQSFFTISPALPSGLILDPATGIISGTPLTLLPITSFTLTATNDSGSSSVTFSIGVKKRSQVIQVVQVNHVTYGDPDFAVTASATSGLAVELVSENSSVVRVALDGELHIVGAGRVTITVRQAGDSTFAAAQEQSFQLVVAPKPITVLGLNAIVSVAGNVAFIGGHLQGLIPGDDVQVGYNGVSGVYRNSVLNTSGLFSLTGSSAANYVLIQPTEIAITNQTNPVSAPWPTLTSQPVISGSTKSVATVGGVPVAFTLKPNLERTGVLFSAPGWSLTMQNFDSFGQSVGIGANGQMQIQLDHTIKTDGTGFAPNAQVIIYIFSTPLEIGRVLTDSSGAFSGEFDVPDGLELGQHTLQITGYSPDGQIQSANIPLELVPASGSVKPPKPPVIDPVPPVVVPPAPTYLPKTYKVNLLFKKGSTKLTAVAKRRLAIAIRLVRGTKDVVAPTMGYATKSEAPTGVIPLGTGRSRNVAAMLLRTIPGVHLVLAHARTPFKGSAGKVMLSIKYFAQTK